MAGEGSASSVGTEFVPIKLDLSQAGEIDWATAGITISYVASTSISPQPNAQDVMYYKPAAGMIRLWKSNASSRAGQLIHPVTNVLANAILNSSTEVTWYIEGIGEGTVEGLITVKFKPNATAVELEDSVYVTVIHSDLDVDSDNNNGTGAPAGDGYEDRIEAAETLDGSAYCGKLICVNDGDKDNDDVVDNVDYHINTNTAHFAQATVTLHEPLKDSMRLKIEYPTDKIHLWIKDANQARTPSPVDQGGDGIMPGVYSGQYLQALGFSFPSTTSTNFYIEGISSSANVPIKISVDPDGIAGSAGFVHTDVVNVSIIKVELFRDDAYTKILDDWPEIDSDRPRSPKYLFGEKDDIYIQVETGAGFGDSFFEAKVTSPSYPTGVILKLHETPGGKYRTTGIAPSRILRLGSSTQFLGEGGFNYAYLKLLDEEVIAVDILVSGTSVGCAKDVMVDRGECLLIGGSDTEGNPQCDVIPYANAAIDGARSQASVLYGWYINGDLPGVVYDPTSNSILNGEDGAYEANKLASWLAGFDDSVATSPADGLYFAGHGGLTELIFFNGIPVDEGDPQYAVSWTPPGELGGGNWPRDVDYLVMSACRVFGWETNPQGGAILWAASVFTGTGLHIALGTSDTVQGGAIDDDMHKFLTKAHAGSTVVDAWKDACLEGILFFSDYGIMVRNSNKLDYLMRPKDVVSQFVTRDDRRANQSFTYYWYDSGHDSHVYGPYAAESVAVRSPQNSPPQRIPELVAMSAAGAIPEIRASSKQRISRRSKAKSVALTDVLAVGDGAPSRQRSGVPLSMSTASEDVSKSILKTLPDGYMLAGTGTMQVMDVDSNFVPDFNSIRSEGEVHHFYRNLNGWRIIGDACVAVFKDGELRQIAFSHTVFDCEDLPRPPETTLDVKARSQEWALLPVDGDFVPVLVVENEGTRLCYDSRDGSLIDVSEMFE